MADYTKAIRVVLEHEGGFVNDPVDPGGATNYGISLRWLSKQGLLGDFDHDGDVDVDDIRKMTRERAVELYYKEWWLKYGYYQLVHDDLATKVFDLAVNMGAKQSGKLLQRAIAQFDSKIEIDGVVGPKTIIAANKIMGESLVVVLRMEAMEFYASLIKKNPEFEKYRRGWTRRAMA